MQTTLYELKEMYLNLMDLDLEGEELGKALESIDDEIEVKAENYAGVIKNLEAEIDAYKKEIERMSKIKKSLESRADYLKKNLEDAMIELDKKKFKTNLFSFNIQRNAPGIKILDEDKIPEEFVEYEKRIKKNDLKKAIKEGLETDAAILVESESLRIR
ncbi:siphovirus Gp157 family protein [Peptoniphilus vaginalis]|uniref:siphovirus Gp157 family protein n=1 Tax=Peptoniphilus vaginalis TaxID=1756987 RepID=UPI0023F7289A|nr:siphovirus Gp157 family protein [Peptoniphilus vaginalis]